MIANKIDKIDAQLWLKLNQSSLNCFNQQKIIHFSLKSKVTYNTVKAFAKCFYPLVMKLGFDFDVNYIIKYFAKFCIL